MWSWIRVRGKRWRSMTEIIALSSDQKWENEREKRRGEKGATGRHLDCAGGNQERRKGTIEGA